MSDGELLEGQGGSDQVVLDESIVTHNERDLLREALDRGAELCVKIGGSCMSPILVPGSEVRVQGCPLPRLATGDLALVCAADGRLLVHRVMLVIPFGGGVITKGDRRFHTDGTIKPKDFLGRVCRIQGGGCVSRTGRCKDDAGTEEYDPRELPHRIRGLFHSFVGAIANLRSIIASR